MKALIIDDSLVHIRNLSKLLEEMGHEVCGHGRNGATGVRLFGKVRPDIVFIDIVMPEMDGLTALRLIRDMDANAKVVVVTSLAGVGGSVAEALELGAAAVAGKPVDAGEIAEIITRLSATPS